MPKSLQRKEIMTIEEQIEEFLEMYGDRLPNPEHQPKIFEYYVRLYKHIKGLEQ